MEEECLSVAIRGLAERAESLEADARLAEQYKGDLRDQLKAAEARHANLRQTIGKLDREACELRAKLDRLFGRTFVVGVLAFIAGCAAACLLR